MGNQLSGIKNPKFTARHYVEIGDLLRKTNADAKIVNEYAEKFKADNPRFDEMRFRTFINSGLNKRSKR